MQADVTFCPVTAQDGALIERLSAFASAVVKEHYDPIIGAVQNDYMIERFQSPRAIREQLENGVSYRFVLRQGEPAGFLAFYPKTDGGTRKLYLSKYYLARSQRGRGVGRRAMAYVEEQAKALGLGAVFLNVNRYNAETIAIYRHFGFVVIREEKNDIGNGFFMDDYVMERKV